MHEAFICLYFVNKENQCYQIFIPLESFNNIEANMNFGRASVHGFMYGIII
jgi:hypothetical protein